MSADPYLGDGAYVRLSDHEVEIYAHNGLNKTNQIFLEAPAVVNLINAIMDLPDRNLIKMVLMRRVEVMGKKAALEKEILKADAKPAEAHFNNIGDMLVYLNEEETK